MRNRFTNAIAIQQGACNPSGIARSLVEAIDECRQDKLNPSDCPACRAICHQLSFILGLPDGLSTDDYVMMMEGCRIGAEARKDDE